MKLPMTLCAMVLASTAIAQAAQSQIDLSVLQSASPQEILEGLGPQRHKDDKDEKDTKKEMPQSCTEAAITPEQKTKIEEAVYQAKREKIQQDADLKLAFMNYSHTLKDPTSDLKAGQDATTQLSDAIQKKVVAHLNLGTKIIFEIVTPEQRAKTFDCMVDMHKKYRRRR